MMLLLLFMSRWSPARTMDGAEPEQELARHDERVLERATGVPRASRRVLHAGGSGGPLHAGVALG
jgi:hypothetical protein